MNRVLLAMVLCAWTFAPSLALAQVQQQAQPEAAAASRFADPAMAFVAPDGYVNKNIPPHDPINFDQPTVVAAFVKNEGRHDASVIQIQMENFNGDVKGFEVNAENELREQIDGVFVKNKQLTTLSNGMPAYFEEVTIGDGFDEMKRYQYLWTDGVRGVILSVTGRYGEISEQQAKQLLADASAVRFPIERYHL